MKKRKDESIMKPSVFIKCAASLLLSLGLTVLAALPCFAVQAESVTVTGRSELQVPADNVEIGFSVESCGNAKSESIKQSDTLSETVTKAVSSYGTVCRNAFYTYRDCNTGEYCTVCHYTLLSDQPKAVSVITDKLIAAGVSSVEPPQYGLQDRTTWEAKALTAAITDAEQRAKLCGAGNRLVALIDRREDFCCYACRDCVCNGTVTVLCTVTLTYKP